MIFEKNDEKSEHKKMWKYDKVTFSYGENNWNDTDKELDDYWFFIEVHVMSQ